MKTCCLLLLLIGVAPSSCSQNMKPDYRFPECLYCGPQQNFYYFADTVFTRHDSVFVVNRRMHRTVIETGLFTYLPYGYPIQTPDELVQLMQAAVRAENVGNVAQATHHYQDAIRFYQQNWLTRKGGFENGGFSDLNESLAFQVNVSLLVSFAFEKLGRLPEALTALAPYMANVEAAKSKIQLRYVQLCIQQYGRPATRHALEESSKTVYRIPSEDSPEIDYWRVKVFGADLGRVLNQG